VLKISKIVSEYQYNKFMDFLVYIRFIFLEQRMFIETSRKMKILGILWVIRFISEEIYEES
jgi:hypothetical protein